MDSRGHARDDVWGSPPLRWSSGPCLPSRYLSSRHAPSRHAPSRHEPSRHEPSRHALSRCLLCATASLLLLATLAVVRPGTTPNDHAGAPTASPAHHAVLTAAEVPHSYDGEGVVPYGDASFYGSPTNLYLSSLVTAMAPTPNGKGYWLAAADGGVFSYGDAGFYGSMGGKPLYAPIVGMAATPNGAGYWLVAADGGVFAFGDAAFYGSMGGRPLNQPVVGMAPTPNGAGYWLVASDGGIFAFGDANFYGSMGGRPLNEPIVAMAATPNGHGYWMAGSDGGVFAFGDAPFLGSLGSTPLYDSITGFAARPDGSGYWMVGYGGQTYGFGTATLGSLAGRVPTIPVTAIVATPSGAGYWLLAPQDFKYTLRPSQVPTSNPLVPGIVSAATSQVGGDPDLSDGAFCNPYGPCEEWCALFSTWTWNMAGIGIPRYPFVGSVYDWGARYGLDLSPSALPTPGDAILYGTGPQTVETAVHMGIVAEVWPNGDIITVEGDAGPGQVGQLNVIINGPFLPKDSPGYNGFPVFAFVDPPS